MKTFQKVGFEERRCSHWTMSLSFKLTAVFELADGMSALDGGLTSIQHVASSYLALYVCPSSRYETGLITVKKKRNGHTAMTYCCTCLRGLYLAVDFKLENQRSAILTILDNLHARLI